MVEKQFDQGCPSDLSGSSTDSLEVLSQPAQPITKGLFSFKIPNWKPPVQPKEMIIAEWEKEDKDSVEAETKELNEAGSYSLQLETEPEALERPDTCLRFPEDAGNIKVALQRLQPEHEVMEESGVKQEDLEHFDSGLGSQVNQENSEEKIPTAIYNMIDLFLSRRGYNIATEVEEGPSVVIRALKYVLEAVSEIPESSTNEPLTLAVAKSAAEEICNCVGIPVGQRMIYCCVFCDIFTGLSFQELFDHVESQHHHADYWRKLMAIDDGQFHRNWRSAPWPKFLPFRCVITHPTLGEGWITVTNTMREILWKMNDFRMMDNSSRLALWFRLSLDWLIRFIGYREPDCDLFFRCAVYIQEDTAHSIFRTIQCNLCGNHSSHQGTKIWSLYDLSRHFKYAHALEEGCGIWMHKMIGLPPDRNFPSFGEEIEDENTKMQWLGLWRISGEGLEILDGLRVVRGLKPAGEIAISAAPLASYSENDILWHPDDMDE